jgi:hypothetical protein
MTASALWTEISPANSDNINQGAQQIRYLRRDARERLEQDHIWNVSTATDGYHKKVTLSDQGSRPGMSTGYSKIWAEDSGGVSQPYMIDGGGNVRQLGVPVGAIIAYLPGYFADGSNGTYTGVAMTLPDGWIVCDGSAPNDADSPIWNTGAKYIPNLTDDRFLMGDVEGSRGGIGGVNTIPSHAGSTFASHNHTNGNTVVAIANHAAHNHIWMTSMLVGATIVSCTYDVGGSLQAIPGAANASYRTLNPTSTYVAQNCYTNIHSAISHSVTTHTHTNSNSGGAVTIVNDHAAGSNMPVYLSVSYIIKIK